MSRSAALGLMPVIALKLKLAAALELRSSMQPAQVEVWLVPLLPVWVMTGWKV